MLSKIKDRLYLIRNNPIVVFFDKLLYRFINHKLPEMSGSMVYFIILSMFPFIIALLNIINFTGIISADTIIPYLYSLPTEISEIVIEFVEELINSSSGKWLTISIFFGLFSASSGIYQLLNNLNVAYGFNKKRSFVTGRLLSIIFAIALIVLIIMLIFTQVFGSMIVNMVFKLIKFDAYLQSIIKLMTLLIPVAYMLIIFSLLYKFAPSHTIRKMLGIKMVLPGAVFSTVGLILMSKLFGFYVANFGRYSITYGSLASMVVMLVWIWLVSLIILLGGEINAIIFSRRYFQELTLWPRNESVLKDILSDEKYNNFDNYKL